MPDIVCFQEVLPHVAAWLKETMQGYYVVGCPRSAVLDSEQECISFRADRYNLIKMDTYWLSETPYVPGSRYAQQSNYPRVCTEVVLQELASNRVFRLVNVHLDHQGALARNLGIRQILDKVSADPLFPDAPVILAGDFNAELDSEEMCFLASQPGYRNVTEGAGATFHDFGSGFTERIDYVFVKGLISCRKMEKWLDCENGVYLSDHYPVAVELEFAE